MIECIERFTDFCPTDRFMIIFIGLLLILLGYIIGTNGRWRRQAKKDLEEKE